MTGSARLVWAAGADKVGHLLAANRKSPTACGLRPWLERYDHPVVRRCPDCSRAEVAS